MSIDCPNSLLKKNNNLLQQFLYLLHSPVRHTGKLLFMSNKSLYEPNKAELTMFG